MVCGVHLGILLVFFLQAKHVHCLWATEAQSSQRQNGNGYVGFSQQDSELERLGASNPQNRLRQASVSPGLTQKSSLGTQPAGSSVYSQGYSSSSYSQTLSRPSQSGFSSVRLVQSSSVSVPKLREPTSKQVNAPKRRFVGLSTAIASGSSVSKYDKEKSDHTDSSKKTTWPVQRTPTTSKYLSSSSASSQSPSSKSSSKLAHHQSATHGTASVKSAYGQKDYFLNQKSSSLFSPRAVSPQRHAVRMQTSATAPARRVSIHRTSKIPRPSTLYSTKKETISSNRYNTPSSHLTQSQSLSFRNQNAPNGVQPRSFQNPSHQRLGYTSTEQNPSSVSSYQKPSWKSRSPTPSDNNPADSRDSGSVRYAPTRTYNIPEQFGGYAIRRLRNPDEQETSAMKPQQTNRVSSAHSVSYRPQVPSFVESGQTYTAPSAQDVSYKQQFQSVNKPAWDSAATSAHHASYKPQVQNIRKPQQTQTAPLAQTVSYKPQFQSVRKPEQTHAASVAHTVSYKPQVYNERKPQTVQMASSARIVSYKPQQSYSAPSARTVLYKPRVENMKLEQTYAAPSAEQTVSHKPQAPRKPQQPQTGPLVSAKSYEQQEARWSRIKSP
ncbi:adhesive plaque matrix protein-like isoform X4 [Xyrichtys novacula]|uniref:Adhesive plaque matrix protein-like isoform X4 n=1 Tax=Xyrichtys novacula TaxID=13765 RepID=A0AAV1HFZ3_XYRNO|nr:adhesive plaque matrix protein-like isoform X4 [Xyrichtys novacula]